MCATVARDKECGHQCIYTGSKLIRCIAGTIFCKYHCRLFDHWVHGKLTIGFEIIALSLQLPATITDRQVPSKNSYISDRSGALSQLAQQRRASSGSIPSDHPGGLNWVMDDADLWRVDYLIYRPMDLRTMEIKASNNKYHSLQEFRADAETVVHNVVIYHGGGVSCFEVDYTIFLSHTSGLYEGLFFISAHKHYFTCLIFGNKMMNSEI
jgi:hypothetical protein